MKIGRGKGGRERLGGMKDGGKKDGRVLGEGRREWV